MSMAYGNHAYLLKSSLRHITDMWASEKMETEKLKPIGRMTTAQVLIKQVWSKDRRKKASELHFARRMTVPRNHARINIYRHRSRYSSKNRT